jgi:acetyl esterase/lipase
MRQAPSPSRGSSFRRVAVLLPVLLLLLAILGANRLVPQSEDITELVNQARAMPPVSGTVHLDLAYRGLFRPGARLDLYQPLTSFETGEAPLVVFFHGGSWIRGDKVTIRIIDRFLRRMRLAGYFVASVNYRSNVLGGFAAPVNNATRSVLWLRERAELYGYDPDNIGLYGISAGGHVALMTEADLRDSGAISFILSECSPVDLVAMAEGDAFESSPALNMLPESYLRRHSPIEYVSGDMPPVLIYHGDADRIVHVRQAYELFDAIRDAGGRAELEIYEDGTHAFLGMPDSLWYEQESRALIFMAENFLN